MEMVKQHLFSFPYRCVAPVFFNLSPDTPQVVYGIMSRN